MSAILKRENRMAIRPPITADSNEISNCYHYRQPIDRPVVNRSVPSSPIPLVSFILLPLPRPFLNLFSSTILLFFKLKFIGNAEIISSDDRSANRWRVRRSHLNGPSSSCKVSEIFKFSRPKYPQFLGMSWKNIGRLQRQGR